MILDISHKNTFLLAINLFVMKIALLFFTTLLFFGSNAHVVFGLSPPLVLKTGLSKVVGGQRFAVSSFRLAPLRMGLNFSPDRLRDLKTLDNAMYSLYDYTYKQLPAQVTEQNLSDHFASCATEYLNAKKLREVGKETTDEAIHNVINEAYSRKNTLIAEEGLAEAANIAAAAAQTAAAVFSWCPGVNLGIEVTALALYGTATGLEIAAEEYEKNVIGYISNIGTHVTEQKGMDIIKTWHTAVSNNGAFYPLLQLGLTHQAQRAVMQAIPVGIQKLKLGSIDADGYKKYIKEIGEFIYNNTEIVDRYERLMASIDNSTTPDEFKDAKAELSKMLPEHVARGVDGFLDFMTGATAIKSGYSMYKARQLVNDEVELADLNEDGEIVGGNAEAEAGWFKESYGFGEAVSIIGAVAVSVMTGFQIKDTVDTDRALSQAIKDVESGLYDYYKLIRDSAIAEGGGSELDKYTFHPFVDSNAGDITHSEKGDTIAYAKECSADPNCRGFNSNGWMKKTLKPESEWTKWTDDATKGLYVKQ
jgi:hypothetical protein